MYIFPLKRFQAFILMIGLIMNSNLAIAENLFEKQTFRAGFYARSFPDFSYEDLEISVKLLSEEIGKNVGIETTVTVFNDIDVMRRAFEEGKINFIVASSLNLVNDFNAKQLADGFRFTMSDYIADSLIVLTRKNEGLDKFESLKGKKLGLVEYDPVADLYIDYLSSTTFKKSYLESFKQIPREKKAQQVILKLFFGQADLICVYQNAFRHAAELNPQLTSKLQIISHIDGIPQGAGLFHINVPAEFREKVIAETIKLETHVRGQQLLQLFKSDKAIRASIADLSTTKQLYNNHQLSNKRR